MKFRICIACKHFSLGQLCGKDYWPPEGELDEGKFFTLNQMAQICKDYKITDLAKKKGWPTGER